MTDEELVASVDWSKFGAIIHSTITCRCGVKYRSHAKLVLCDVGMLPVSMFPCPKCGKHTSIRAISDDPQVMML